VASTVVWIGVIRLGWFVRIGGVRVEGLFQSQVFVLRTAIARKAMTLSSYRITATMCTALSLTHAADIPF
jgi:hypothetical protein